MGKKLFVFLTFLLLQMIFILENYIVNSTMDQTQSLGRPQKKPKKQQLKLNKKSMKSKLKLKKFEKNYRRHQKNLMITSIKSWKWKMALKKFQTVSLQSRSKKKSKKPKKK